MSDMDLNTVKKVANLARIELKDEELQKIAPQLNTIIDWVEQLGEANTDGIEPLQNVVDIDLKQRKDEVTDGDCQEAVLSNAPEKAQGFYVVQKVVE